MRGLILTHKGLEKIAAKEAQEIANAKIKTIEEGSVTFECESEQDLANLCYKSRVATKVALILLEYDLRGKIPETLPDLKEYLAQRAVVECKREGEHNFTSFDAERKLNKALTEKYGVQIDHKTPQTIVYAYIKQDTCRIGIDFSGEDLGRRDYRIFLGRESIKGTLAAGLLILAGYTGDETLADPFCRHGTIAIEAALIASNTSPHKYRKDKFAFAKLPNKKFKLEDEEREFKGKIYCIDPNFKHISAAKKNAKIAGVVKKISFSRTETEWLDTKLKEKSVDMIVTLPQRASRRTPFEKIEHYYDQLFDAASFILKPRGKMGLAIAKEGKYVKEKANEHKFSIKEEHKISQGKEEYTYTILSNST